jgi:hypothetical protein
MASPELARRYLPSSEMWMLQVLQKWRYGICYRQQYRCELRAGLSTAWHRTLGAATGRRAGKS